MRLRTRGAPLALLLAILFPGVSWNAAAEEGYAGSEQCAACHEEIAGAFRKTAHATAPGWDAGRGCESCHGPGAAHADSGDPALIARPATLTPRQATDICLGCHSEQNALFSFRSGTHSRSDVSCVDCHNPHSTSEQMLRKGRVELCATCHQAIAGQFRLPRSHPLDDKGDGCVACHNPHGSKNVRMAWRFGNETCGGCHMDKEGPFVYEHDVALMDGCRSCHQLHGSPNRHLLVDSRSINLCYKCHTAAQTPGWHSAPDFLNEKCTACHTAIHGSNTNPFFLEE